MVDASASATAHLEKMGRELKCPICLSLLKSSVSLTSCNHVFCNLCLTKSMKTDSHCPVCKVPYRPREIRPAPHMDNLVTIYRNMEVASGLTIHVTQNPPPATITSPPHHNKPTKQKLRGRNKPTSDPHKPSFPAKKRVHVPQPETPNTTANYEDALGEKGPSNVFKEKPSFTPSGNPVFSPFFWLRDRAEGDKDEIERLSSQTTEMDNVADTPQQIFSFSDIKDSPLEMTGNGKVDTQFKTADAFDSEMFEWTQRPCSPELSSTPVKDKVAYKNKMVRMQENKEAGPQFVTAHSREEHDSENTKQGNGSTESRSLSSQKAKAANKSSKSSKSRKSTKKQGKLFLGKTTGDPNGSSGSDHFTNDIVPNTGNTMQKKNKKVTIVVKALNKTATDALQCDQAKIPTQCNKNINKSTDFARENFVSAESPNIDSCKTTKRKRKNQKIPCKNQKEDTTVVTVLKEVSVNQEQRNENAMNQYPLLSVQKDDCMTYLDKNAASMEIDSQDKRKSHMNVKGRKRLRISNDNTAKSEFVGGILKGCSTTCEQKTQKLTGFPKDNQNKGLDNAQTSNEVQAVTKDAKLQKYESTLDQICCAFCHSSKDSKVCGKMMHYSNGRPVASDYNGESTIIHAHRDCTEWAPNVYFEDEIAFNLESELARSRRIKCSCCGLKGAALGCYEKSCRKSFHVPCAKSMSQCRWDAENFVMLCPLHSSSNLPKDLSQSQGKKTKKNTSERKSRDHQAEATVHHGGSSTPSWKGSSNKLVLCCSGLNNAEKEIVSKFTKMAGVSLLKTYGPSVTHIIASTDENGACRRTLKILLGILDGKWILKIEWIKACIEAMEPVSEAEYEIGVDIHGIRDGPRLGRLRILNKQPKLFKGCSFYFIGEFVSSYKGYLQDMVVAAGGTVLQRKPVSGDTCELSCESTFIIYNSETPEECDSGKRSECNGRRAEAEALAMSNGAKVAGHWWVLDSIAACKLQPL